MTMSGTSDIKDIRGVVAGAAQEGRVPMGDTAIDQITSVRTVSTFAHPELIRAKYAMQLSDPALVPGAAPRSPVMSERLGAKYDVNVPTATAPLTNPEAGNTQANGKIVPPKIVRSMDSFQGGVRS